MILKKSILLSFVYIGCLTAEDMIQIKKIKFIAEAYYQVDANRQLKYQGPSFVYICKRNNELNLAFAKVEYNANHVRANFVFE